MSGTTYQYILSLNDKMSATLKKVGYLGSKEYDKLQAKQEKLNQTASSFTGIATKLGLAFGAFGFGKKIIDAGAEIEQTRVSFATFLGSVEKGNAMIKQLQDYADVTPFTAKTLQDSTKTLLGFGITGEQIMPTLKMLGDISGGNADKMQSLTLAFAQMQSAGKLMGQDLLQMINAGFNPLQVISQKTGKSMAVLRKEMEQGEITTEMVTDAFRTATSEGGLFYGMMNKMGQTVKGRWSTLMDTVDKIFRKWGEDANGTVGGIIDKLTGLARFVIDHLETITKWSVRLLAVIGIWKAITVSMAVATAVQNWYNTAIRQTNASLFVLGKRFLGASAASGVYTGFAGAASLASQLFAGSIRAIGAAIYSIPIVGWILAAVSGLILLWQKSEKFRGVLFGIAEVFKISVAAIGNAFTWFKEKILQPIWDWFANIGGFVGKAIDAIISSLRWLFQPIIDLWNKFTKSNIAVDFKTGYNKGVEHFRASKDKAGANHAMPGLDTPAAITGEMGTGSLGTGGSSIDTTSRGIATGGNRPTNINITLGNLVESLTINPASMKEGATEIERMVKEALLRVLNSANGVAYGN